MSVLELRDTLYNAAPAGDWSDMGGPAEIIVAEESPTVGIIHRQSQQMKLLRTLDQLRKNQEEEERRR